MSACRQALRARPCGPPFGDGGAGHPLGGGEVGQGPDGVGMVTVMCCCRARWRAGSYGSGPASSATRSGTTRARGCAARGGGRGRGRARRRRGLAPRGASGGCCRPACRTRARRRLLQPQRKHAALRLPDSIATAAWPASRGERVASRVARAAVADLGQQLRGGDHAAGVEQREEDLPVGMLADRGGDLALELLDLRVERLDRRDQASARAGGGWPARARRRDPRARAGASPAAARASGGRSSARGPGTRPRRASPSPRASAGLG